MSVVSHYSAKVSEPPLQFKGLRTTNIVNTKDPGLGDGKWFLEGLIRDVMRLLETFLTGQNISRHHSQFSSSITKCDVTHLLWTKEYTNK
jgi:hypothetical protein